jgi:hypothetical protein
VNLYAYAGNNPIAFSDPFGLCNKDKPHDCDDQEHAAKVAAAAGAGHQLGNGCPAISDACDASALVPTSTQELAGRVAEVTGAAAVGVAIPAALTAATGTSTVAATDATSVAGRQVVGRAITGFTKHGINQIINRGVGPAALLNAARNGTTTGPLIDNMGREALKITGDAAAFVVNLLGEVVTAYRR